MIKAVIFDWGGVLIEDPTSALIRYCANSLGVDEESFEQTYLTSTPEFQKGKIREDILWEKVCHKLGVPKPCTFSLWGDALRNAYVPKKEMFSLASDLHKNGYKIGLLSNTEIPTMRYFNQQDYSMFDAAVFSCSEGTIKPEKRIYEIILKKLNVSAQEAVFIDDQPSYVDGAKKCGINGILFKNLYQLKKQLALLSIETE